MEKQARDSAKISKAVGDAYAAYVRGDISQAEYKKAIEDQVPAYKETQTSTWRLGRSSVYDFKTIARLLHFG